ncbi:hypothetical protein [Pyxidicoccus xibeiensis]|uniref:hypothetical protein n=1 Tax=Pyxidicoccus xibeiensis TaxID=2906759 RepID=UPI0020A75056|nr:hypothetical protein [Pyxidicoccus xibeiensis]MCP3143595.1 hypothetical protein [Pyxidicoccus xibeiensis]
MCCFSRSVESVSDTNIFARDDQGVDQFLVYSMRFSAKEDLAMVLPLPVPRGTGEDAVRFINLEKYPSFFNDMAAGFSASRVLRGAPQNAPRAPMSAPLRVVKVGGFEASFVPTVADFERLDARFRLPAGTWERLPEYRDLGFAVFKLRKEAHSVHPMAFRFPRREPERLFFPTVHIHDGKVRKEARFDHSLYCQPGSNKQDRLDEARLGPWQGTPEEASTFMKTPLAQGIVNPAESCYRLRLNGVRKNEDTRV